MMINMVRLLLRQLVINALRLTKKKPEDLKVFSGVGAGFSTKIL